MILQAIFIYCLCDELLKHHGIKDDQQCRMTSAEVMTFVIIASLHHQGNYQKARMIMKALNYFPNMLSYSRLVCRIHNIPASLWSCVFHICQETLKRDLSKDFIVDSFPIPICQNNKIFRCKLLKGKKYHGYSASKKRYFYGVKVHMIVTKSGIPVEFLLTPGAEADVRAFRRFSCDLPEGSTIFADAAYNDRRYEELLLEAASLKLVPKRKKNSKRKNSIDDEFLLSITRNRVETVFSAIKSLMPSCIRASSTKGFFLKIYFFILAYTVKRVYPAT